MTRGSSASDPGGLARASIPHAHPPRSAEAASPAPAAPPPTARHRAAGDDLLYRAAQLYYLQDATQAEIAAALGTSRPTVSRLLTEARSRGIVHIEVRDPRRHDTEGLAADLAAALGLVRAWVTPGTAGLQVGAALAPAVGEALLDAQLRPGDAALVSSGATIYEVSQQTLPPLPGVVMAPTVGGQDEPEAYYQTNEITRQMAVKCLAQPLFLYAPAMPGPELYDILMHDPSVTPVVSLWRRAGAALLGIGAPPAQRTSVPSVMPRDPAFLRAAVGDICARPFDRDGRPIAFGGSERLVAVELEALRDIPATIGVAVGAAKVEGIVVAARAGYLNRLVTDRDTALALLDRVAEERP